MLTGKIISAFEKCLLFVSFIEILSYVGKPSTPSFFLDQSPFVKHFGKTVNCGKLIIKNWSETQKLTITQQLMSGVRYLDMRVAYLKEEDSFCPWFTWFQINNPTGRSEDIYKKSSKGSHFY